jgi:hypothetical protein
MDEKLSVLCVSDNKYLPFLYSFLNSLDRNCSCVDKVIICLINVPNLKFKKYNFEIEIFNEFQSIDDTKNKLTRYSCGTLNGRYMSQFHAYCNNIRYFLIPFLLKTHKNLLYVDVDNIIRKDLNELLKLINNNDICIHKYPLGLHPVSWREFMTFACGIIGIKQSEKTISFFEELKTEIINNDFLSVGDQLDFYKIWVKHQSDIKIHNLELKYKDHTFLENSYIWSGDGNAKESSIYVNEMKNYI